MSTFRHMGPKYLKVVFTFRLTKIGRIDPISIIECLLWFRILNLKFLKFKIETFQNVKLCCCIILHVTYRISYRSFSVNFLFLNLPILELVEIELELKYAYGLIYASCEVLNM